MSAQWLPRAETVRAMGGDVDKYVEELKEQIDRLRLAFLRYVRDDNQCAAWEMQERCREAKCGCALEMQQYIDAA